MARHTLTHASEIFHGGAQHNGAHQSKRGVPLTPIVQVDLGAPDTADADGIATSQTPAAGGEQALSLTADPVTLDVPRNVTVTSAGDETGRTFTVTGTDEYGEDMTEDITGANAGVASGAKAFKTVSSVTVDANTAGAVTVGFGDVLGLPYRIGGEYDLLAFYADATEELGSSTVVAGDDTAATATTGDVRGTVDPNTAADGSVNFRAWMKIHDPGSKTGAYGVAQA